VQAQGSAGDIFIGITTSGNSKNVLNALEVAKLEGLVSVVFCGSGGVASKIADHAISVPSDCTPYIQESHIVIGHMICSLVETNVFPR
jgi:D-sedoheptulose 7-phosphate isomerase